MAANVCLCVPVHKYTLCHSLDQRTLKGQNTSALQDIFFIHLVYNIKGKSFLTFALIFSRYNGYSPLSGFGQFPERGAEVAEGLRHVELNRFFGDLHALGDLMIGEVFGDAQFHGSLTPFR